MPFYLSQRLFKNQKQHGALYFYGWNWVYLCLYYEQGNETSNIAQRIAQWTQGKNLKISILIPTSVRCLRANVSFHKSLSSKSYGNLVEWKTVSEWLKLPAICPLSRWDFSSVCSHTREIICRLKMAVYTYQMVKNPKGQLKCLLCSSNIAALFEVVGRYHVVEH